MKKILAALVILAAAASGLSAAVTHGKTAGTVAQKNEVKKEIVIRCADKDVPILLGSRLYIMVDSTPVSLDVTFPMMASATCRLTPKYASYFKQINGGMTVYYGSGPVENPEKTGMTRSGEMKTAAGIELVSLLGGTFMMGGRDEDENAQINEKPVHRITLSPFWMSRTEITQGVFETVMGKNPSSFAGNKNRPADSVSWYDAVEFCNALSIKAGLKPVYIISKSRKDPQNTNPSDTLKWTITVSANADGFRLPTEAEWEFACRAGTESPYFNGQKADKDYSWFEKNADDATHDVAKKKANPAGLFDMTGNVWEWCQDWHDESYYRVSAELNPAGPASGSEKILRGGSWINSGENMRSSVRNWSSPAEASNNMGFRVVLSGCRK